MVKKTLLKAFGRDIRQSAARFFSILTITALGAGFFVGLRATGPDMFRTADEYYSRTNLMDYRIISSMGFTEEDAEALRQMEGIAAVMPAQRADVLVNSAIGEKPMRIHSLPDLSREDGGMNRLVLLEGRLPESPNECVVGKTVFASEALFQVGDKLTISPGNPDATLDFFLEKELTVVGLALSPLYPSRMLGSTTIGTGVIYNYVFLPSESFDLDVYTELYIKASETLGLSAFSAEYAELISEKTVQIEAFGEERVAIRYDEIYSEAASELEKAQAEFDEKKAETQTELDDARLKIEEAENQLAENESALLSAQSKLAANESRLAGLKTTIEDAALQLEAAGQELEESAREIESARAELEEGWAAFNVELAAYNEKLWEFNARKEQFGPGYENIPAFQEAQVQLDEMKLSLDEAQARLIAAQAELDAAQARFVQSQAELDKKALELESARDEYENGILALASAKSQIESSRPEIETARLDLETAKTEYLESEESASEAISEAESSLSDARRRLRELEKPKWYVYTRDSISGYSGFSSDAGRVAGLATFISVFFFFVAALVCLTTMTRMVEEQRLQIGALKALGYGRLGIAMRYVGYSSLASALGAAEGIAIGLYVFPLTVWNAYKIIYQMPEISLGGNTGLILATGLVSLLCTAIAAFAACYGSMSAVPAQLMRPKAPRAGKRVALEYIPFIWKRLKFSNKVTARNLFLNKKRLVMTLIGVLGCTAILLSGLGLRDSITGIVRLQFGVIELYDAKVSLYDSSNSLEDTSLNSYIREVGELIYYETVGVDISGGDGEKTSLDASLYIAEDPVRLNEFIRFAERDGAPIEFPRGNGVILTEKLANDLKVSAGDTIEVSTKETDGSDILAVLTVSGVMENYVYHYVYITPETYRASFGLEPSYTIASVRFEGAARENAAGHIARIIEDENVVSALDTAILRDSVDDMLSSLNSIIVLIIASAVLLAVVVLYNLTNINITERFREIATLKVLGYREREIRRYIFGEGRVLTLLGIGLGLVGGYYLTQYVIISSEVSEVMFRRGISPLSYLYSAVFTLLTAETVNLIMRRRLKRIDMVESLGNL